MSHALTWPEKFLQCLSVSECKCSFKQLLFLLPVEVSHEAASGLSITACHSHTGLEDFCGLF